MMDLMTKPDFDALLQSERGEYYKGRWAYFSEVIRIADACSVQSALEIGPGMLPVIKDADILLNPQEDQFGTPSAFPGKKIVRFFGVVTGSTVRAKHIGRDLMASLKNIVGGELKGYTELLHEARDEALKRMQEEAASLGANAVVNVRFSTSSVAQGAAELFAYGTAVTVE